MRNLFIALEGIDGCGKSTQIMLLVKHLFGIDKHKHVLLTREPYKEMEIRKILMADKDAFSQAEKLARLFVEDRKNHVKEVIIPALMNGCFVVSDRYKLSTISYQAAQGLDMNELIEMHSGLPAPDITFIIDLPAEIASERMKKEAERKEHKFEANADFLEKVRQNYLKTKELLGENIFVINGNRKQEEVFNDIRIIIDRELLMSEKN